MKKLLCLVAAAAVGLAACSREGTSMQDQLARADGISSTSTRLAALIELDQAHPGTFGVKYRLGELYLSLGQLDVAAVYLKSADALKHSRGVTAEAAQSANLEYARALILLGRPTDATTVVAPSVRSGSADALLVRARAYVQAGDIKSALNDFRAAWDTKDVKKTAADYALYAQVLGAESSPAQGLALLQECERSFGYQPGTGLLESSLLEKLGKWLPSILAVYKESLYQQTRGTITEAQIDANLGALSARIDVPGVRTVQGSKLIAGLKAYLHGRWAEASVALAAGLKDVDDPFGRFLRLSCALESAKVSASLITDYVTMEDRYRGYPAFYYHLWRGMKRGPGTYARTNVRDILEKTVLLAPSSSFALETRGELGRLIGVDDADAQWLLLRAELDSVYGRLLAGADPGSVLPPVLRLLSIRRENVYTSDGVLMLKSAASLPGVAAYLAQQLKTATGTLRDRLMQIR